jgi:hypothetical protein
MFPEKPQLLLSHANSAPKFSLKSKLLAATWEKFTDTEMKVTIVKWKYAQKGRFKGKYNNKSNLILTKARK